jgi:hypothetical protein
VAIECVTKLLKLLEKDRGRFIEVYEDFRHHFPELTSSETLGNYAALYSRFTTSPNEGDREEAMKLVSSANKFENQMMRASSGRTLIRTSKKYLGLAPHWLRPGDEVWILERALVPFILRPCDDQQYRTVGEAYVHGIMHGEAFGMGDFDGNFATVLIT